LICWSKQPSVGAKIAFAPAFCSPGYEHQQCNFYLGHFKCLKKDMFLTKEGKQKLGKIWTGLIGF